MSRIKHAGMSLMTSVALVTLSACGNSAPEVAPKANGSPSESQAQVQKSPRADAQALVVQACDAYDVTYEREQSKYFNQIQVNGSDSTLLPNMYNKMKSIWNPLAQAALEDARWSQALYSFNLAFEFDAATDDPETQMLKSDTAAQAKTNFQSTCQIARSSSRVDLGK